MKKVFSVAIIFLILIPYFTQASSGKSEEEILLYIMDELDGNVIKEDISASEKIIDNFLSVSELDKVGQDVLDSMGMIGEESKLSSKEMEEGYYLKDVIQDEEYHQVSYFGYDSNKNPVTIILTSYINLDENGETFLYINKLKREIFVEDSGIIDEVKSVFLKFNKEVNVTTCFIGEISGKFNEETINKARKSILDLNGTVVDEYKDGNLMSLTGFTDYIDYDILAGEDRINLNIALRYQEYDNKTIIWIGTPIITSGY